MLVVPHIEVNENSLCRNLPLTEPKGIPQNSKKYVKNLQNTLQHKNQ